MWPAYETEFETPGLKRKIEEISNVQESHDEVKCLWFGIRLEQIYTPTQPASKNKVRFKSGQN